jgi:hypothetical protein
VNVEFPLVYAVLTLSSHWLQGAQSNQHRFSWGQVPWINWVLKLLKNPWSIGYGTPLAAL